MCVSDLYMLYSSYVEQGCDHKFILNQYMSNSLFKTLHLSENVAIANKTIFC